MKNNIKGVGVALVTPFSADGTVDYAALGTLVESVIAGGVDYLVALGTTAETPTLSVDEKREIARFVVRQNNGRLPLVVGIGGNNTAEVTAQIEAFDFTGYDYLLSVTPYYNKPSQQGLYAHYSAVAAASPRPVILYNVPGRTGVNMTAETTLKLAHGHNNIVAVKEASGNLSQASYILRDRPEGFLVLSGDDNQALPLIALGGDGIISVAANAFPRQFCRMVKAACSGNMTVASTLHLQMMEGVDALFEEGNPTGIKAALAVQGMIQNHLRLPLIPAGDRLVERIRGLIAQYKLA